ncbi:MAG TPA: pyridoxamine 5'-phosphate oxidase family protein [Steroidobacteraceae bacterium]|nr:pyridoxamine 5'-phosphate oxidase family protein [Steroidobacteraceae bacterium]HRX90849.1 pyridoxamine 5'-phosphate oxidase family protein [Steroidobacteraceae bacterium]
MDQKLQSAIEKLHEPAAWVHLATVGRDGGPHVTPMMMGLKPPHLLFSFTGKQKVRNLERDPRGCVAISKPGTMAHVIVWGPIVLRHDAEAQAIWNEMISRAFGPEGLGQRNRALSPEGTQLGLMTPERHRIYGLD